MLPLHRAVTAQPVAAGYLAFAERFDPALQRTVTCATLSSETGIAMLQPLHDAVVRMIDFDCLTIHGYERDDASGACNVQSWRASIEPSRVVVSPLYRASIPVPRHALPTVSVQPTGSLRLVEQHDPVFRRTVALGLLHGDGADYLLPQLRDAVVRFIQDGRMTISGFEADEISRRCVAQSWYVRRLA